MNTIKEILDGTLKIWGVCPFSEIENSLIECRAKNRLPENACSVITALFPYLLDDEKYEGLNVSRYAAVTDYHGAVMKYLEKAVMRLKEKYPDNCFAAFADNSPIPEVTAACKAGLGVRGRNSLLINREYGSYVFIGEIVTDLYIPCKPNEIRSCLSCGKCVSSCPGGAITENGIDKSRCLSHITQKKGELTEDEKSMMRQCGCLWGCDICQLVCPMNNGVKKTFIHEFKTDIKPRLDKSTDISGRAFEWRGKKVIDRNIEVIQAKGEREPFLQN